MHTDLPQELLDEIISYLSHTDIPSLALVSKNIQSITYARLYRDIPAVCPKKTVLLLKVLSKRPYLAEIVRICTLLDLKAYGLVIWSTAFFQLMSKALRNMRNLKDLRLYAIGPYAAYLMGCPFRLHSLRVACDWNQELINWLEEQNQIYDIWVFSLRHAGNVEMPSSILPLLRRTLGSVRALSELVPARPVESADISFPSPDGFNAEIIGLTCKVLSHSSGPLTELFLTVDLTDLEVPHILETLAVVPDILPNLHTFGLFGARGFVSANLVERFTEVISKFKDLKKASLYSTQLNDALSDHLVTKELPQRWHKACASLESIDINGVPWLHVPNDGWMTTETCKLRMLDMLSEARKEEARLRKKLKEAQRRNALNRIA
ncbi:hypothetical protein QCA50_004292 [Cerrena zonata]|uniref:F-box domain-containing protein n=1 Tax=Cerrena zonata TaxID=2478898 RepID=A0AAW0GNK6_9APHY